MKLRILHTNDIHSNYENFSKVVTKINECRDHNTILLDAGDFADFKRIELQGTDGIAAMELLEEAGYDALAIGNNETFQGIDCLKYMALNSKVPLLSSNLLSSSGNAIEHVRKSITLYKNGLRILIIAASPNLGPFAELMGFTMKDYVVAIQDELDAHINDYDICILLSHLGMDKDKEIAEKIRCIDVIIGGHEHILMEEPELVNNVIIFTSGAYGEHLGKLELDVENGKVELFDGCNIAISQCEPSNEIQTVIQRNKEKAITKLSEPFGYIKRDLWHDVVEENPMTNLLADALHDIFKCDLGIINSGVINGGIKKGEVSKKKVIELCPSPLNPTMFKIQGKDLWEALQSSLDSDICYADGKGAGFRGKYLGRLHVSNAVIEHDGRNISNILIHGEKLIVEKWYTVAASDYLQRGTGFSSLANNLDERYNKEFLRDIIQEYLVKEEIVEKALVDRWILQKGLISY